MEENKGEDRETPESLSELIKRRQELDRKLQSEYSRELAVMFTDITGSTKFYETHGDIDGRIILETHDQLLRPVLDRHGGRFIKNTGDGMLAVFKSASDAVQAAIQMQRTLAKYNAGKKGHEQVLVRVAVNYGTVMEDKGDVYGLEVNIADRIKCLTGTGQVLISRSVYERVCGSGAFICQEIPSSKVKGVEEPLRLYEVIWEDKLLAEGKRRFAEGNVFVLEASKEGRKIKLSGYEKGAGEQKTVRHYEELEVDDSAIDRHVMEVLSLLNQANQKGKVSRDIVGRLKTAGQLLYDGIFSTEMKRKLSTTQAEDLIISVDDHLVNIPWELLYDGRSFLCLRFNVGRLVSTRQRISEFTAREVALPVKMLIVSDPQGNLKSAYREGFSIRDRLGPRENLVHVNIRSNSVDSSYVMGEIRNFDIFHYAGHADYDIADPSRSGFLLEDRKLTASDIISLVGEKPLPSLVFSNACKSGHAGPWKVGKDFEAKIYGLANAFLLAGVRHYMGTFWDVKDEQSLHFALYFYDELMEGAMIGEAVRRARLHLIEKYGEEAIIWASYLLYGDPTFRYVSSVMPEARRDVRRKPLPRQEREAVAQDVRSGENVVVFGSRNQNRILAGAAALVVLLMVVVGLFLYRGNVPVSQGPPEKAVAPADGGKRQRVHELVTSLLKAYEEGKARGPAETDPGKSLPLTLVFLDVRGKGISEEDTDYILARLTGVLQGAGRVRVVEREVLDALLEELRLSASELADPSTALRVGRILSARLITTGRLLREGNDWQASLRIVETETTAIKAALAESIRTGDKEEVAEVLGKALLERLRAEYPLYGRIVSLEEDAIVLNVGSGEGIVPGMKMAVFGDAQGEKVGEVEITSVQEASSRGRIVSRSGDLREGLTVRELL